MLFSIPRGWKPHLPGKLHPLVGSVSNRAVIERNNKPHLPGLEKLELPKYFLNLYLVCGVLEYISQKPVMQPHFLEMV